MEETMFLLMCLALIISWGIIIVFVPRHWMRKYKLKYVLKENEFLRRDRKRYELIKVYRTPKKFLELLRQLCYEDIDDFILTKIRTFFRGALNSLEGFLSIYLFIGTLEGKMNNLLQKIFLECFRDRGSLFCGIFLHDSVIEKGQPTKAAIEKTIADIDDIYFSRKCYFHAAERLGTYITTELGDIVDADFKTELQKELLRLKSLSV